MTGYSTTAVYVTARYKKLDPAILACVGLRLRAQGGGCVIAVRSPG